MSKCYRCGYCCIYTCVAIVINPDKSISEDNIILHNADGENKPCKYLLGNNPGEYTCSIHGKAWYKDTPCASHNAGIDYCNIGKHYLNSKNKV